MNRVPPLSTDKLLEAAPFLQQMRENGITIPTSFHVLGYRPGVLEAFGPFFGAITVSYTHLTLPTIYSV